MQHDRPDGLVIFDVDGTLVQSIGVDGRCFVQAVQDVLGVAEVGTDWETYRYQTDSGLVLEISGKGGAGIATEREIRDVRERFLQLLRQETARSGFTLREHPGAQDLLGLLRRHPGWGVAIATGGWEQSARFKLELAGVDVDGFPLSSADDHIARENIILCAMEQAKERYRQSSFSRVVYVGDASWDADAADNLYVGFVGVGDIPWKSGVSVVRDFSQPEAFVGLLESATPAGVRQPVTRLVEAPQDIEACRQLFREFADLLDFDLGFQNFEAELAGLPGGYAPPTGRLLLALKDRTPAGCVALRGLDDRVCELKRLWVRSEFRGTGLGRQLAKAIIDEGQCAGYHCMRLDTMPSMRAAITLYRALGFREIAPCTENPVPGAMFMQRDLRESKL